MKTARRDFTSKDHRPKVPTVQASVYVGSQPMPCDCCGRFGPTRHVTFRPASLIGAVQFSACHSCATDTEAAGVTDFLAPDWLAA